MSENLLFNNLNIVTAEIKLLETNMTRSLVENGWEIGKRLMYVKTKIKHGEFGNWVDKNFGFSHQYANQFMKFYNDNPNYNSSSNFNKLPSWKHVVEVMYLPDTVDKESFIEEEVIKDDGETKTAKEIAHYKKELKEQAEIHQRQLAEKDEVINKTYEKLRKEQQREPQIVEKIPDDYEFLQVNNQALETRLKESNAKLNDMAKRHKELLDQRKEVDEKSEKYDELTEAIQKAQGQLNNTQKIISDYKGVMQLLRESNDMVMKVSGLVYMDISDVVLTDNSASREFGNLLRRLTQLTNDLSKLTTKNIIEGEFTDE